MMLIYDFDAESKGNSKYNKYSTGVWFPLPAEIMKILFKVDDLLKPILIKGSILNCSCRSINSMYTSIMWCGPLYLFRDPLLHEIYLRFDNVLSLIYLNN
jgi:hypothetical protein